MIVAVGAISCLVSSWMISHFGKKPERGGRPARERSVSIRVAFITGVFAHEVIIVVSLRVLVVLIVRKIGMVIRQ